MRRKARPAVPGFWRACWIHRNRILKAGKPWITLAIGTVVAVALPAPQLKAITVSLAGAELTIATALLGVVLAGMAVLVVFLSEGYLEALAQLPDPIGRFERILFQFWFTAGLAAGTVVWDLSILLTAELAPQVFRRALLGGSTWFILWTLSEVIAVVSLISLHGGNRARQMLRDLANRRQQDE